MGRKNKGLSVSAADSSNIKSKHASIEKPLQPQRSSIQTSTTLSNRKYNNKHKGNVRRDKMKSGSGSKKQKGLDPLVVARRQYEYNREEKRKQAEERNRQRQQKEIENRKKQKERRKMGRLLTLKTKSGQPVMAHKINYLLNKIQNTQA